ncbi:MAG: PCRF domain-containing protein, partial [Cyanobacteria bacterium J06606_4]
MAETYLIQKLDSVKQTFEELTRRMADPDVAKDPDEFQKIAKMRASLEETVNTYHDWQQTDQDLTGAREVYKESTSDPELKEMAGLEVEELEEKLAALEKRLKILL